MLILKSNSVPQDELQQWVGAIALKSNQVEWMLIQTVDHLLPDFFTLRSDAMTSRSLIIEAVFKALDELADASNAPNLFHRKNLKKRIDRAFKRRDHYVHGYVMVDENDNLNIMSARQPKPAKVALKHLEETYALLDRLAGDLWMTGTMLATNFPKERLAQFETFGVKLMVELAPPLNRK